MDPSYLMQIGMGFWPAKVLLSAVELELFTILGEDAKTASELESTLGLHPRATGDFLDALVALRLLEKTVENEVTRYKNTDETAYFLDKNGSHYLGGFFAMCNTRLYRFWDGLTDALKTGEPQNELRHSNKPLFEELYSDHDRLEEFLKAMAGISRANFEAFARAFDFTRYDTLCDIGGATGLLSTLCAEHNEHITATSCDLEPVTRIAQKHIEASGQSARVEARMLDFFAEPFPEADVITMSLILHDWNLETKKELIAKAYAAIPEGGCFVAIEHLIDDARQENAFGLLMSLNMLIETGEGFDFTAHDFDAWCLEAGFQNTEVLPLQGPASAAIAYK